MKSKAMEEKFTNWRDINPLDATQLAQAEFKGFMTKAVQDIDKRIDRIERKDDNRSLVNLLTSGITAALMSIFVGRMKF